MKARTHLEGPQLLAGSGWNPAASSAGRPRQLRNWVTGPACTLPRPWHAELLSTMAAVVEGLGRDGRGMDHKSTSLHRWKCEGAASCLPPVCCSSSCSAAALCLRWLFPGAQLVVGRPSVCSVHVVAAVSCACPVAWLVGGNLRMLDGEACRGS